MPTPERHPERDALIYEARLSGRPLAAIAAAHRLSVERIRQLCYLEAARRRDALPGTTPDTPAR